MSDGVRTAARPRILYVVHRFPYPPDKGDRIRAFQILRHLSQHADVHVASLADEPVSEADVLELKRHCRAIEAIPLEPRLRWARALFSLGTGRTATEGAFASPAFAALLRRWAAETRFDVVLASSSGMAPFLRAPALRDIPAVVDLVDVDSQKWLDYAAANRGPKAWLYRLEGYRLRRLEQALPDWTRAITLVSSAEVGIYRQFCTAGRVLAVSNGVDLDFFRPREPSAGEGCVFVGALDYRPNIDAACWFAQEVWPEILRRHPGTTFSLVGRCPAPPVQRLAKLPGVDLVGQVPDVRPYLARAAVAVVPLRIARGVQNKVLEALAMARATVASPQALEGIQAQPGQHLLSARDRGDWVEAVGGLLSDAGARERLGLSGRAFTEQHHHWDRCLAPLEALLAESTLQRGAATITPAGPNNAGG